MYQKQKPFRSKKYLEFVRSLPCTITGVEGNSIAHHIIDCEMGGCMGAKPSDLFTIPLESGLHQFFHSEGFSAGLDQKAEALRTIEKAIRVGVLKAE